jgi:hypothetical protein
MRTTTARVHVGWTVRWAAFPDLLAFLPPITRRRGEKVRALIPLNLDGYLFSDNWKSGYRAEIRR